MCLAGGLGARGRGLGRARGGAEALWSTTPLWLPVGLGTGQVPRRMGAQGPGWAAPRPAGASEASGAREQGLGRWLLGAGVDRAGSQTSPGPPVPEQ